VRTAPTTPTLGLDAWAIIDSSQESETTSVSSFKKHKNSASDLDAALLHISEKLNTPGYLYISIPESANSERSSKVWGSSEPLSTISIS
jgi:hypothetical protein